MPGIPGISAKNTAYSNGTLSKEAYADYLKTVFNDTSKEMTDKVETILKKAKENAFALEVDSGKDDMVTGKVWINYAWSGDAVYAMDEAESIDETYLYYSVPEEGSNIWFDGWVMPKGANKHLAQAFLDYISEPTNAYENMYYIGYTSAIAGQYVFDKVIENYGCDPEDEGAEAVDLYTSSTISKATLSFM